MQKKLQLAMGVVSESVRRGTGYDIACTIEAGRGVEFELTEVTGSLDIPLALAALLLR